MINTSDFHHTLLRQGIDFFCGVPDSLLKELCACISDKGSAQKNMITANEGSAIAVAAGHHLGTGQIAAVYMQNSGLGNAINPLLSLADPEVYAIPMLLLIGWRGEPNVPDEPQHFKQGKVTEALLQSMGIPYQILDAESDYKRIISELMSRAKTENRPVALLVKKATFSEYPKHNTPCSASLSREQALAIILDQLPDHRIVSTTGKTSRELYELRQVRGEDQRDFLTVGSMGHASAIALGLALSCPDRGIICLDGDGALLMHTGIMSNIGKAVPANLIHILINNGCHESVGAQPSAADIVDFAALAQAMAYPHYFLADTSESLSQALLAADAVSGPTLLEIRVKSGSRKDLGRPKHSPKECKQRFMEGNK